jgi:hypothetical protein
MYFPPPIERNPKRKEDGVCANNDSSVSETHNYQKGGVSSDMMRAESSHPTKKPRRERLDNRDHLLLCAMEMLRCEIPAGDIGSLFGNEIRGSKAMELKFRACVLARLESPECRDLRETTNHKLTKTATEEAKSDLLTGMPFTFLHVVVFCAAFRLWATFFFDVDKKVALHISPRNAPEAQQQEPNQVFLISYSKQNGSFTLDRQNVDLLPVAVDGKPSFCLHQYHKELGPIGTYSIKELRTMATETLFELKPNVPHNNFSSEKTVLEINCMKKPELYAHIQSQLHQLCDFSVPKIGEPRFS